MKMWISGSAVSRKYIDMYEKIYNKYENSHVTKKEVCCKINRCSSQNNS